MLIDHPQVADVAVIGVPNEDFGEEVKAVVQPVDARDVGPAMAAELIAFCREQRCGLVQVPADGRLRRQPAPARDGQALQENCSGIDTGQSQVNDPNKGDAFPLKTAGPTES